MSDIENSGDDTIAVAKKNGSIALKENNVTKNVTKTNDEKVDADMEDHDTSDKLNGSAASPKKVSDKDRSIMNGEGNGVSDAEDSITNGKWTDDGETSHPATDDDSVLEATPTPSSRNSPRKTLNDEYSSTDESNSDEFDEEEDVEEIKDDEDEDDEAGGSSDSIMEVDTETEADGRAEKTKSNIVTIDDVKTLQSLAKKSQQLENDKMASNTVDAKSLLSGKSTSGVTITPAKSRILPLGGATIGSGITISHAGKQMSRGVGLPVGTTMTSVHSAASASNNSGFTYDKQGQLNDPNLTDDTFVVEAPSFIVPYVYEKPPKETFTAFKESVEKIAGGEKEENEKKKDEVKEKEEKKDEKESDEKTTEEDDSTTDAKKTTTTSELFFGSSLGKFLMNIGMNLVQEHVQTDLLREQMKRSQKDKSASVMHAIMSLKKNLEVSKDKNESFRFDLRKCRFCSFRTESQVVLECHMETPHMKNGMLRCNYCHFETKNPADILSHMQGIHAVRGKLERSIAPHQCPQCPFEDGMRGKLTRHKVGCDKRFRPDRNQEPPHDWEPPAKIPKPSQFNRTGRPNMPFGAGSNQNFHSLTGGAGLSGLAGVNQAARIAAGLGVSNFGQQQNRSFGGLPNLQFGPRGRGRPVGTYKPGQPGFPQGFRQIAPGVGINRQLVGSSLLSAGNGQSRYSSMSPAALLNNLGANSSVTIQSISQRNSSPRTGQPSISITPLPGRPAPNAARPNPSPQQSPQTTLKPGQPSGQGKSNFVICEICDGYIKDLEQLRNHMQWIHKVKIHPKMIYNRPPLNCQKCQFRFFTDQGLERHLLGSHGLVTASMQDLANKGQDSGRCPVCGKVYQWKLLSHVSKDHSKILKPAHLSYKCTVCTATFGQYKLFENHVYTAHSGGNKKSGDKGGSASQSASTSATKGEGDEVSIIPQAKALTAARNESKKNPTKKSESDADVIELDDEGDEEIDDVEEPSQRTPVKRGNSSTDGSSSAKKSRADDHDVEDESEEGVEEINDDDE